MRASSPISKLSTSSRQWLSRQFRDPYVKQRMIDGPGFRSRSAYKLLEMDDKYHFLGGLRYHSNPIIRHPRVIVDLGAAPGGWSQVAAFKTGHPLVSEKTKTKSRHPEERSFGLKENVKGPRDDSWSDDSTASDKELPKIISLDLHRMDRIIGVTSLQADFLSPVAEVLIQGNLPPEYRLQSVDLLLSDMAANATGNSTVDAANSLRISQAVFQFACRHLTVRGQNDSGGVMILKHFEHPDSTAFWKKYIRPSFCSVYNFKPPSSRSESSERYWVCLGFLGYRGRFVPPEIPDVEGEQLDLRNGPFYWRPDFIH